MQTILGSNGQIGYELVKELHRNYTKNLRLVSRKPQKIHETDEVVPANLLNKEETEKAIEGSDIVYFTVGLPMDSKLWEDQFLIMMGNVIEACRKTHSKLVFFDNTYMYPKNDTPQTEKTAFQPVGRKATVRGKMADLVLNEMAKGEMELMICRAPEFYGPGKTQSITNTMIFNRIKEGKKARIPLKKDTLRTLIYTPDASRSMALLGNTPSAYGETWHLPTAESITYEELLNKIEKITQQKVTYQVMPYWQFYIGSFFHSSVKELMELLPRYKEDNLFLSNKFKKAFPQFQITSFDEGIREIFKEGK